MWSKSSFAAVLMAGLANAHMHMSDPVSLGLDANTAGDYNAPLNPNGSNFPCRGFLNTPDANLTAVATWAAGSDQTFTITGGAPHDGGSCQASLSEDGGKTWKVIKSYIGACPTASGQKFDFTVPEAAKSGDAIFAWSWFNKVGNREMYMNCAAVEITGGSGKGLDDLPDMFEANIGNGCTSNLPDGKNAVLEFPNPGKDVVRSDEKTAPPVGTCATGGSGSGSGSGGDSGSGSGDESGSGSGTGGSGESSAAAAPAPTTSAAAGGSDGGAAPAPTQTFDDGLYHPPTPTPTNAETGGDAAAPVAPSSAPAESAPAAKPTDSAAVPAEPTDSAAAPAEPTDSAAVPAEPTDSAAVPQPTATAAAPDAQEEYKIVMVIDGKTQTGKAYLTAPSATPAAYRRRAVPFNA